MTSAGNTWDDNLAKDMVAVIYDGASNLSNSAGSMMSELREDMLRDFEAIKAAFNCQDTEHATLSAERMAVENALSEAQSMFSVTCCGAGNFDSEEWVDTGIGQAEYGGEQEEAIPAPPPRYRYEEAARAVPERQDQGSVTLTLIEPVELDAVVPNQQQHGDLLDFSDSPPVHADATAPASLRVDGDLLDLSDTRAETQPPVHQIHGLSSLDFSPTSAACPETTELPLQQPDGLLNLDVSDKSAIVEKKVQLHQMDDLLDF